MILLENVRAMSGQSGAKRFLVDPQWPKGIVRFIPHKEESGAKKAGLAEIRWCPQLAPKAETWSWFLTNPDKIDRFRRRYFKELALKKRHWLPILQRSLKQNIALLYDAKHLPSTPAHFFKEFLDFQANPNKSRRRLPEHMKYVVHPGLGVAVSVDKAISRKGARPLLTEEMKKENAKFEKGQKLVFVSPEKRRVLR